MLTFVFAIGWVVIGLACFSVIIDGLKQANIEIKNPYLYLLTLFTTIACWLLTPFVLIIIGCVVFYQVRRESEV